MFLGGKLESRAGGFTGPNMLGTTSDEPQTSEPEAADWSELATLICCHFGRFSLSDISSPGVLGIISILARGGSGVPFT